MVFCILSYTKTKVTKTKFDVNLIKFSGFGTRNLFNGFRLSSKKYSLTNDSLRSFRSLFQFLLPKNDSFPFSFRKFCL